ncbi:tyrosine-type recombinase/integrase [Nocardioides sp. MAH-18]|uniref:Tyrosine-type recombinase/integrase n=1 Tax=Nocardioides agri TaxID=2682843 RepID=A0A6L6XY90_9ACTN|nr:MULTISPECIES: site-specific integrase [unclassified Nocardioides]MBA2952190.1 site-specific integrase [Nocardioides sp. CGMCC 1.13656]MVQ51356.1 tyrosine-type recombinase/integrase [Nocardioides sp. MAH-18]
MAGTIKKLADGKYQVRFRDGDGRQVAKRFKLRKEAQNWLDEQVAALVRGDYVDPSASKVTFRAYAEKWRAAQLHHRDGTADHIESRLRLHVYPVIGGRQIGTLRRTDIQTVVTTASKTLAPSTVRLIYSLVATILNSAVMDQHIARTPCVRINLPEVVDKKVSPLTIEQLEAIVAALPERYRAMAIVGAATGMRSGELRGLTLDRISPALFPRGLRMPETVTITVDRQLIRTRERVPQFGPPKTPRADRLVTIGVSTIKVLVEHLETYGTGPEGLIFSSRVGGPIERSAAGGVWQRVAADLGLPARSGWHDLRHFHASLLIADGRSVRAVADRLGHADVAETLRTYAHLWPNDEERSVSATEAAIGHLSA